MSGVYNRKLFRQGPARDELRKLGGIMSSSEELMREALRTAENAPRPAGPGPMSLPMQPPQMPMAQPQMMPQMMQPQMPMMQPQMMQPQMPMAQPMAQPAPQMPMPMGQEPAYMPPQVPGSVQPQALRAGGLADAGGREAYAERFRNSPAIEEKDPALAMTPAEAIDADVRDKAADLMPRLDTEEPEAIADEIITTAATKGVEITGDTQVDLARIYQNLTGDPAAFEKNIDSLNRGIIGAAIGSGTSARATENISKGLLVGLQGAKDTEERRLSDTRTLQLAEIQARTAEANKRERGLGGLGGVDGAESRDYRNPVDAFQDAYQTVMRAGEYDAAIPEGMTREQYAEQVATALIQRSYTPDQLVGSPFEGMSVAGGETPPPAAANPTGEDVLNQARAAIAAGADEAIVRERLQSLGIDPESL